MIFEFIRQLTCDFNKIENFVPKKGTILDVGCGHGIFSKLLADTSEKRIVLGIDPSAAKISKALSNYRKTKKLTFKKAYIYEITNNKFDVITIIDVMYLLPEKEKLLMLVNTKRLLKKSGSLILVINGKKPILIHKVLQIQEYIMTTLLKFTYTDFRKVYFEDRNKYIKLLDNAGFEVIQEEYIKSFLPYPHVLFKASPKSIR